VWTLTRLIADLGGIAAPAAAIGSSSQVENLWLIFGCEALYTWEVTTITSSL
jgi:hypothetical protein